MTYLLFYIGGYIFTVWTTCRLLPTETNDDILKCSILWPIILPCVYFLWLKDEYNLGNKIYKLLNLWKGVK